MNKRLISIFTFFQILIPFTAVKAQSDFSSGEEIPFGFTDIQIGFFNSRETKYSVVTSTDVNGNSTFRLDEAKSSALFGIGLDVHLALLYTFLNKDESRFRIAEDIGIGCYALSGVGIRAFAGAQCAYRINDVFDIGLKYYPFYQQTDYKSHVGYVIGNSAYGFKARVGIFYLDYTSIKTKNKYSEGESGRYHEIKLRGLYDEDSDYMNNFSLIFGFANRKNAAPDQVNLPPIYTEFSNTKNRYITFQIGWGACF